MKQVLQNMSNGATSVADVPFPQSRNGMPIIQSTVSLVSAGTERMLVEFGKAGYLAKARQQPDKVKEVLTKVKTDGLIETVDAVRSKLDQPLPLGYCNVGVVLDSANTEFEVGSRIISNGAHAEVVRVPKNLCAAIPDGVDDESAAFTVLASIGLQGVRLLEPTLGENVVVSGLGLVGLLSVQILRANGCRVLGIDFDSSRCELARQFGADTVDLSRGEDPMAAAAGFSRGRGVDAVLICASSKSDDIIHQSAQMCRQRGRVVLVGVIGLNLRRDDFYKKEISLQVSSSYGPGRYDPQYEDAGIDYPVGFVRWTEQRNFEAVLDLMAAGSIDVKPLITHRYQISDAEEAYGTLGNDSSALGILLNYPAPTDPDQLRKDNVVLAPAALATAGTTTSVAFLGAGNYASRVLIPAFQAGGAQLHTIISSGGVTAVHNGKKFGFTHAGTNTQSVFDSADITSVVVATRHNSHAKLVLDAIRHQKHVFVEKPLALTLDDVEEISAAYAKRESDISVMVGFNRRFAPQIIKVKSILDNIREPKAFVMTMNAGAIPGESWVQDPEVGGGRIIGEACHYIDLMRFLAGAPIISVQATGMGAHDAIEISEDKASITLGFADGSFGTIHYLANGSKAFPKERIEVFAANSVLHLDNFKRLTAYDCPGFKSLNLRRQDKGQGACAKAFIDSIKQGAPSPIPFDELIEVAKVTIDAAMQIRRVG